MGTILIPKVDHPENLSQFRPISLCNVRYKLITKVVANRLKCFMPKLIGPMQSSFVPGRHITDNIIIAQEAFFSMNRKKGKVGWMAIKVDLEKEYDRLNWGFIEDTLKDVGIPIKMLSVIMRCISSSSMRLLWNGQPTEEFVPSRGIRQGDPLSPYIFVLCMERLAHLISTKVQNGEWKPLTVAKKAPKLSHLFFADDLVLFAKASLDQVAVISKVLDNFCAFSGHRISKEKTTIFFSKNTDPVVASQIGDGFGFQITNNIGKYLGVPLIHGRTTTNSYSYLVDKLQMRSSSYHSSRLSLGGRTTLAKTVLSALPIYTMQISVLPCSTCTKLDALCRNFIWGSSGEQRKIDLVCWDMVCKPKNYEGLGIKKLAWVNEAFMMKLAWGILANEDDFWVKMIRGIYLSHGDSPNPQWAGQKSTLWRGISKCWSTMKKGMGWALGDGKKIRFWLDNWLDLPGPLVDYAIATIPDRLIHMVVHDAVDSNGQWAWDMLQNFLPLQILTQIAANKPPSADDGNDEMYWKLSKSGKFTIESA